MSQPQSSRSTLRSSLRTARNALSNVEQQFAAKQLEQQFQFLAPQVKTVGLYLANDGEINPEMAIKCCWSKGISVVLPVLDPVHKGQLVFQRYEPQTPLPENQYGIPEPQYDVREVVPLNQIDILFMPLVGFDHNGNRLGMGGGYYDRTLENVNTCAPQLTLVGLAHDCQQVDSLPNQSWDVPVHLILTPSQKLITKHGEKTTKLPL